MQLNVQQDITLETLDEQFGLVKELTLESHVMHYGNLSMAEEPVSWFQGPREDVLMTSKSIGMPHDHRISWPSRDVELLHLQKMRLLVAQSSSATVEHEITRIKEERHKIEEVFTNLVNHFVADETERRQLFKKKGVVENLDCHDDVVRAFDSICIDINKHDYALAYMNVMNNLCTKLNDSMEIIKAMEAVCSETRSQFF